LKCVEDPYLPILLKCSCFSRSGAWDSACLTRFLVMPPNCWSSNHTGHSKNLGSGLALTLLRTEFPGLGKVLEVRRVGNKKQWHLSLSVTSVLRRATEQLGTWSSAIFPGLW
jgi:hypothetical protein